MIDAEFLKTRIAMAKTPGEHEPTRPISKEEREARKAFRQIEAEKAMTDHEIAKEAFATNHERLRAERLAREAKMPAATKVKPKARRK
jgi:hypothetical protein